MPVILTESDWSKWLGEEPTTEEALMATSSPCLDEASKIWPVDKKVGNVRNKGAELALPIQREFRDETVTMILRKFSLAIVACLLLPAVASAASMQGKRYVYRWHGYGFLPGYHQPPNKSVPIYASKGSIHGTPDYAPSYWYGGGRYYFGEPRFSHDRWNGGSNGPCWTYTPIGRMLNCG